MKRRLSVESIGVIDDGRVQAALNREIERVVEDCLDRPGDETAREVTMKIAIKPESGQAGVCEDCDVEFEIKSKLPPVRSKRYQMRPEGNGGLVFNDLSPEAVRQGTLDEVDGGAL